MAPRPWNRSEKFAITLFGVMTALIVLPGLLLTAVSILSTGAIDLPHSF